MDDLNVRLGIWCIAGRLFFEPEVFSQLILRIILIHSIVLGDEGIALSRLTLSFIVHSLIQIVTNFYSSFTYSTEECCKTSFPHCLLKKQASILKLKHQATNMINHIICWFSWSLQPQIAPLLVNITKLRQLKEKCYKVQRLYFLLVDTSLVTISNVPLFLMFYLWIFF